MRASARLALFGIFLTFASVAFGSGGPVDEVEFECQSKDGKNLIVVRRHQAYSSEYRGDVLIYSGKNRQSNMLSSLSTCLERGKGSFAEPVDEDLANIDSLMFCGIPLSEKDGSVKANKKGYRAFFWKTGNASTVRVQENGKPLFGGDLSCRETKL